MTVRRLMFAMLASCVLAACAMVKLHGDAAEFYDSTVFVGRMETPTGWNGAVVVGAWTSEAGTARFVHATRLHEPGGYELIVPRGAYRLFAFGDANDNGIYDAGEPAGEYDGGAVVRASGTGVVAGLDLAVAHGTRPPAAIAPGTSFTCGACAAGTPHSTQAGAPIDFDAPRFSAASGARGYWSPMEFFRDVGGNVWFVEPYDPQRIPVLFVHGAAGSAQDWRQFVDRLDRTRYQAWIFQYPSGASVDSIAHLLFWKLLNLQVRHRFPTLYVTAHSMGGLVVRRFLLDHGEQLPQVRLFVSLSTPWAGEEMASVGVRHSPAVVPSWRDMQPEGRFMQTLFAQRLPAHVDYYLLFGHRGGYSLLRPNHDGSVTLASQLRGPAQAEARRVFGFDEDHTSILASPAVFAQYRSIVDEHAGGRAAARTGHVHVAFDFSDLGDGARGLPVLRLRRIGGDGKPVDGSLLLEVGPHDAGRTVGPIPAGDYEANLVAGSFRTEPRRARLHVGADTTPTLSFRLTPQGTLSGYIGADAQPGDKPAGSWRPPHRSVTVRSISLIGETGTRTIAPRPLSNDDFVDLYLEGIDAAVGAHFSFVGVPGGSYQLAIEADGYLPYRARVTITPGRPAPLEPIVLVRSAGAAR